VLYGHARLDRLASHQIVAAMQMQHALDWLREGSLVITPGDRGDVIVGMLQAHESFNYPNLAGLLLTGLRPERAIERLIGGLREPLPILSVPTDTYTTVSRLREIHSPLQSGDPEKIEWGLRCFERAVDVEGLLRQVRVAAPREITPRMFDHNLMQQARGDRQRIVLPESQDPRILRATARILAQGLATPILLGEPAEIDRDPAAAGD
jgi:phosphate acetyltransferase